MNGEILLRLIPEGSGDEAADRIWYHQAEFKRTTRTSTGTHCMPSDLVHILLRSKYQYILSV
jgi:hypothetical protein